MEHNNRFIIPFIGLALGKHSFVFDVDTSLFQQYQYDKIQECKITVDLIMDKSETMLDLAFHIFGKAVSACERCLDTIEIPIDINEKLIVNLFAKKTEFDDFFWELSGQENKIDVTHFVYETIVLAMPENIKHFEVEDCNPDIVKYLNNNS